jgi:preprotein translocase subunit SecG
MFTIVLIIQLLIIIAMITTVLLQRSEGGALGMGGGGGGGGGGLMSSRGAGNALSRMTAILAGLFFICSIALTVLARGQVDTGLNYDLDADALTAPAENPATSDVSPVVLPDSTGETGPAADTATQDSSGNSDDNSGQSEGASEAQPQPTSEDEENRPAIPE